MDRSVDTPGRRTCTAGWGDCKEMVKERKQD